MNTLLGVLTLERNFKERIKKVCRYSDPLKIANEFYQVPWRTSIRHLLWPMHNRNWASRGFTELVRRGQHHMDTNQYLPVEYNTADSSDTSSDSS